MTSAWGLAVDRLLSRDKNCIVYSLFFILIMIIIISSSSSSKSFVALLNCLYPNP